MCAHLRTHVALLLSKVGLHSGGEGRRGAPRVAAIVAAV